MPPTNSCVGLVCVKCVDLSVMSDSLRLHGLWLARFLSIEFSKNTGVDSCSLPQGIFPTRGWNPGLLHCRQILYRLSHVQLFTFWPKRRDVTSGIRFPETGTSTLLADSLYCLLGLHALMSKWPWQGPTRQRTEGGLEQDQTRN